MAAYRALVDTFSGGGKLLTCGNGGSAADSEHIVGELMKGFLHPRPLPAAEKAALTQQAGSLGERIASGLQGALPAISLTSQTALNTAVLNDNDPELIFAQQVYGLGRPGDGLLGISTSGNSLNVVCAVQVAKLKGLRTIALTGRSGGRLLGEVDVCIRVPAERVTEVQEYHLPVYHAICLMLEAHFFDA